MTFDPHIDCEICKTDNNNQEGTTNMTDYTTNGVTTSLTPLADITALREKIAELQIERDNAKAREARNETELEAVRSAYRTLKSSLQYDLKEWAEQYLQSGDDDYKELSELMVNNGLDGLKRTFNVTVKVTYEFEVEVEATDEDSARDEVDNDLTTHIHDNVSLYDYPDDYEISDVEEV